MFWEGIGAIHHLDGLNDALLREVLLHGVVEVSHQALTRQHMQQHVAGTCKPRGRAHKPQRTMMIYSICRLAKLQ